MQSIAHTLENNRLTAELEQVLQTYLSSENKEVQSFAIERLVSLYIQNHNASALETLINQWLPEGNLPLDKSFVLLRAYREINKNSQIQSLLDSMRTAFTNNNIIAQWGSSLLSEMRSNGMEESARDLIKQWLDDHELPARTRMQFVSSLHSLGNSEEALTYMEDMLPDLSDRYQRRTILDRLLNQYLSMNDRDNFNRIADVYLNEPDVQSWQLNSLANYFEQAGMYDKALELCERIAMEAEQSGDTSLLNTIHQRKINIFIETGDTRQALQYAEKCMLTDPNNPDSHDLLGRIYEAAGQPDNALQAYCRSLELSPNEHNYMSLISKINNLVLNYDVSFNPDQLAASLLKENRTPQALAAVASLVSHYKPIEELTPYFTEALESELSSNGKQQIYQQWLSLVRENGNQEQELTLLRQYVDVVRYDMKISVQRDISRILLQNGQYEDVVKENTALLDSLPSSPDNAYHIQSIKRDLMNAFVKLGDNDAAWKLANELSDSNNGYDDLIRLGTQLGKTDAVIEKLEKIVGDSSEQNINIYLYLARAYKEHGREDNVKAMVASVEKSLQDAPYNQKRLLLSLYQQLDMPEKTEGLLKEMIGTAPQNEREQVTDQLFNLWRQQNRLDDALDFARTQPETPRLFSMIGELYFAEKDYQNAFDYYRKAYESSGNGQEQWRQDQYQSRLIQAAVQCDDKTIIDDIAYSILEDTRTSSEEQQQRAAQVYQQAGNYEKAADHYMRAVSEAENSDKKRALQQQYATCLNQNKQYDKAIQVYADMLNAPQLPFDTWCYTQRNLMNTYQTADYPNKAQEARRELVNAYERFVRRNPNGRRSGEIKLSLASEYSRAGNTSQACSLYEDIVRAHKGSYAAREAEQRLKSITTKY